MVFDPLKPYNDLPELPPSGDIETRMVLKKVAAAGRALAELKGLGETIPDQAVLVNSILLQEARVSSEIENIITTNDALFRALVAAPQAGIDSATKEVLRYREALWTGFEDLTRHGLLTANVLIRVVNTNYLRELERIGVLRSYRIGKENLFVNVRLFDLLSQ